MFKDGKYIYCIIATEYDSNFGAIGVGGRGDLVTTIGFDGLCMVVSDHPLTKFTVNPENILAHQKVIEEVMKEFSSVLPLKFGTIAATPDEIRNLLNRRYSEFMELLKGFDNKIEVNLKCWWKDMAEIYKEIDNKCEPLKHIRKQMEQETDQQKKKEKMIEAGKLVETALKEKKEEQAEEILMAFRKSVFEYKEKNTTGEAMFFNTAFLINSGREKEIDNIISDLDQKYLDRIDFSYTSPLPVFNFIDLKIFPERWET
ncbi:MAG: GvpL/GvpF family gas vesicle protein [Bacteroidales bacterium]|nr:GvpL/GvpF family gas vesicle protein [Bacteroidales bacterium]